MLKIYCYIFDRFYLKYLYILKQYNNEINYQEYRNYICFCNLEKSEES